MRIRRLLLATACLTLLNASPRPAKNVILFVGDGMGIATVTAARIYEGQLRGRTGEENLLSFEAFPNVALVKTYSLDMQVAESAATMTAIITGVKTVYGALATDSAGKPRTTLIEHAESRGLATGVVSTARITHATPAACYAHSTERSGELDLARQLIEFSVGNGLEVALGGGRLNFLPKHASGAREDGRDLTVEWAKKPDSRYVSNRAQFQAIDASAAGHVLGLFSPSHMSFEADRAGDGTGEPSLSEMTAKAIDILSRNRKGFVLVVEGGRIDHSHHAGNAFHALNETVELARAVAVAVQKTKRDETLIVVTADHSHVMTISGYPTRGNPILGKVMENVRGAAPRLAKDKNGLPYTTLSYANGPGHRPRVDLTTVDTTAPAYLQEATIPMNGETHGGEDVAAYASGPGSERLRGVIEQNVIFDIIVKALGWSMSPQKR